MNRFTIAAAAFLAGIATQASAEPFRFYDNGELFVGERVQQGEQIVYTGVNKTTADHFTFRVNKGWVNGTIGGRTVRFHVEDAKRGI